MEKRKRWEEGNGKRRKGVKGILGVPFLETRGGNHK